MFHRFEPVILSLELVRPSQLRSSHCGAVNEQCTLNSTPDERFIGGLILVSHHEPSGSSNLGSSGRGVFVTFDSAQNTLMEIGK